MTDSDLQRRVMEALSPRPTQLGLDVIAYRRFDKAPATVYTRFLGEQAASVVVRSPHDERSVLDFLLETAEADLAAATAEMPLAVRSSRAAQGLEFEVRVVVHPAVQELAQSEVRLPLDTAPFLASVTYLTFPAFRRECTEVDSVDAARAMLERVPYTRWDRLAH
ncbi:MAG TPA: hypothetical protein VI197_20875 [Polyangiaceae bacterium]